jgi:hypothetical protein
MSFKNFLKMAEFLPGGTQILVYAYLAKEPELLSSRDFFDHVTHTTNCADQRNAYFFT